MRAASIAATFVAGTVFASFVAFAWTGPTAAPPNNNVPAPINVGTVDQIKSAGIGMNSLAVFGNAILSGASRYLNFGSTVGTSGYGFRDSNGTMQFKNEGGAWQNFATGVSSGGTSLTVPDCDDDEVLTGRDGQLVCVSVPSSSGSGSAPSSGASCAGKNVRWGPASTNPDCGGLYYCSNSISDAPHGTVRVVNDHIHNGQTQGSATYQCNDGDWVGAGGSCRRRGSCGDT